VGELRGEDDHVLACGRRRRVLTMVMPVLSGAQSRIALKVAAVLMLTISPAWCVEPGLGDIPFYCNPGSPVS
jgi:hypothetical protein